VGTSRALVDSTCDSGYANCLFGRSSSGLPDDEWGKFVRSMHDAFYYDPVISFHFLCNANVRKVYACSH